MYHIIEALARWFAPVLSFTADEIWKFIPGKRSESVFLEEWYHGFTDLTGMDESLAYWDQIIAIRDAVSKELEKVRVSGEIGAGLDAEIDLYCDEKIATLLYGLKDELRFVLITSYARVHPAEKKVSSAIQPEINGIWIKVAASTHAKCVRCWHHREEVGKDKNHPELCGRCIGNVDGPGETRQFA
jgi:isoleucyl-tRNA synthetase